MASKGGGLMPVTKNGCDLFGVSEEFGEEYRYKMNGRFWKCFLLYHFVERNQLLKGYYINIQLSLEVNFFFSLNLKVV